MRQYVFTLAILVSGVLLTSAKATDISEEGDAYRWCTLNSGHSDKQSDRTIHVEASDPLTDEVITKLLPLLDKQPFVRLNDRQIGETDIRKPLNGRRLYVLRAVWFEGTGPGHDDIRAWYSPDRRRLSIIVSALVGRGTTLTHSAVMFDIPYKVDSVAIDCAFAE